MPTTDKQTKLAELPELRLPDWLGSDEQALLTEMLEAWRAWRLSRRNELLTIQSDLRTIVEFIQFARAIPGHAQPEHFERWAAHLYEVRQVRPGTQRRYQTAVRTFFEFLVRTPRLRNQVRQTLGVDIVQVSTPENSIIHRREKEQDGEQYRSALTDEQAEAFFGALDREIAYAYSMGSKSLHALQRDKVMFALMFDAGLRNREVSLLHVDSFRPNPSFDDFGRFGLVSVYGKGRKWRTLPLFDPTVARLLEWYMQEVRPRFLQPDKPEPRAIFLSERGVPINPKSIWGRFKRVLAPVGLSYDIVPHCLRHTTVSNSAIDGLSIEAIRQRAGHEYSATTQGYTHFSDAFTQQEFGRIIRRNLP